MANDKFEPFRYLEMKGSVAAIIPAAGHSARMGTDKALLRAGQGMTFSGKLIEGFSVFGCKPVVLIVNEQFGNDPCRSENLLTIVNHHPDKGRSWSVMLGLKHVPDGCACYIQNVDNPFISADLLDKLLRLVQPGNYVVPECASRGGHPILLGSKVVDFFRKKQGLVDFRRELNHFTRVGVPFPDERILWNINTAEDYKEFTRMSQGFDKNM